jgi:hypothetical protein
MPGQLETAGSQARKPVPWAPLFIEDLWPGLYTNRAALHDPSGLYERKYMGGRPGSLINGLNTEISVRNTIIRRYGLSQFSTAIYETAPLGAFSFEHLDGTIQVLIDTSTTGGLTVTSVGNSSGGSAVYHGTFPGGASNAYVGLIFVISGFVTNLSNNSPTGFVCTASSTTTLTLSNPGAVAESAAAEAISYGAVWIDNQNGSRTFLFGKGAGAGQMHYTAVAGVLYMGDGTDTRKYTPGNTNGVLWNWGIAPPTVAPALTVTESASAAATWMQLTVFSTMGLLLDATGNIQSLISVNASGTNTTQFGLTGTGTPAWNTAPGGTTPDGGVTWTNWGPIPAWMAHTLYTNASVGGTPASPSQIYDPTSNTVQINIAAGSAAGTSGNVKPAFAAIQGATLHDPPGGNTPPNVKWFGIFPPPSAWQPSHGYTTFFGTDTANTCVIEPGTLPGSTTSPVTLQICTTAGTSASAGTQPFSTVLGTSGVQTRDGDLIWLALGSATRVDGGSYTPWTGQGSIFSVVVVGGRFYVCTASSGVAGTGVSQFSGTSYGTVVGDGGVSWTDAGPTIGWAASTNWYLPLQGFAPKSASQPYGGASITDSNGDLQTVIATGKSKANPHPVWNAPGATTSDGTITWFNEGVANVNSLVWKTSHTWSYSYKARSLTDFYSVPINGVLPVPPGITAPPYGGLIALPPPTGSETNVISTASPVTSILGGNTGAVVTLKIPYCNDPQCDTIVVWRDADGGGSDNMFELTEVPNIPQPAGTTAYAFVQDYFPDVPETLNGVSYPGLNVLIPAPIDGTNNPPDPTFLPEAYNFERIWGPQQGNQVNFSGGPDVVTGNPNEAFSAADEFPFLSNVIRTVKSTLGLIVYTRNSIEIIEGGPLTASFNSVTLAAGVGLGNFNALDIFAGEQFFMDTTGQLRVLSPTLSLTSAGQPITDQLINFNPQTCYIAFNEQPNDSAIYVATGLGGFAGLVGTPTGWFRMNPRQVPGGANGPEPVWSPFAEISNGCWMVQSIEVSPGIKKLLVGPAGLTGGIIRERNLGIFTDAPVQGAGGGGGGAFDNAVVDNGISSSTINISGSTNNANEYAIYMTASDGGGPQNPDPGVGWTRISTASGPVFGVYETLYGMFVPTASPVSITFGSLGVDFSSILAFFGTNGSNPGLAQTTVITTHVAIAPTVGLPAFASNNTAGNTIIVGVAGNSVTALMTNPSVTDTQGNTYVLVENTNNFALSGVCQAIMFIALNVKAGPNTVTFAQSGGSGDVSLSASEFTNIIALTAPSPNAYEANFQIGNIWLSHRGEIAVVKFIEADFAEVTTTPIVSYLLNEISGPFTNLLVGRFDPPQIYGDTLAPTSYNPLRFYFPQTGKLARCVHLQLGVDFGVVPNADEIYNLTIYGMVLKGL